MTMMQVSTCAGSSGWLHITEFHLQFLRWYTGARRQTHTQIILKAGNRLPLMQHWLRRALQLWNKLSTADPDSWLAHAAFLSNIQLWQSGCNTCWTARIMAHMQQLGLLNDPGSQQQPLWSQQFDPDSIEVAMDAIMTAAWDSYQHRPYRQLGETHCEGRTLFCYAQYFLGLSNSTARRLVYHNIPASAWGHGDMQLATGRLRLRCVTAHWHGHQRSHSSCCPRCPGALEDPAHYLFILFIVTSAQLRSRCDVWLALKASLQAVHHVLYAASESGC